MTCCKTSYNLCEPVPACIKQLIIKTPVISANVTLRFLDKFGKIYYVTKTANSSGLVTIQVQDDGLLTKDLPLALLNEYAGAFFVLLFNASAVQVKWTISSVEYDAIGFIVGNVTPVINTYTIDPTSQEGEAGDFSFDFSADFSTI
jgi:hypothetical protein